MENSLMEWILIFILITCILITVYSAVIIVKFFKDNKDEIDNIKMLDKVLKSKNVADIDYVEEAKKENELLKETIKSLEELNVLLKERELQRKPALLPDLAKAIKEADKKEFEKVNKDYVFYTYIETKRESAKWKVVIEERKGGIIDFKTREIYSNAEHLAFALIKASKGFEEPYK